MVLVRKHGIDILCAYQQRRGANSDVEDVDTFLATPPPEYQYMVDCWASLFSPRFGDPPFDETVSSDSEGINQQSVTHELVVAVNNEDSYDDAHINDNPENLYDFSILAANHQQQATDNIQLSNDCVQVDEINSSSFQHIRHVEGRLHDDTSQNVVSSLADNERELSVEDGDFRQQAAAPGSSPAGWL